MTVHWVITCYVFETYEAASVLSISVLLNNPAETGTWGVYVTDADGAILSNLNI